MSTVKFSAHGHVTELDKAYANQEEKSDHTGYPERQPTRQRTTNATKINKPSQEVNTCWEQLATDQFDPWQVVPRQVFTPFSRLLISTAFVVASCVGCLVVTGVVIQILQKR